MAINLLFFALLQPVATLSKPTATTPEPLSQILSIRELSDGRVIVIDFKDKVVQLLDREHGLIKTIGREGKGPGEYAMPMGLVPMANDLTYLVDPMTQRFLPIAPDGSTADPISFSSLAPGFMLTAAPLVDQKGRLFFQSFTASMASLNADSAAILRLDPASKRIDTAGYFRPQKINLSMESGKVRLGAVMMFAPEEAWTATPDGRVVRAVPEPYHLISYGAGSAAEPTFAPTKPPFTGRMALMSAPNGEVWVERSRPYGDGNGGLFDRFDRKGIRIGQVRLNPKSRVVGFGRGTVYVVRRDADDLQYLERYVFPR